MSAPEPKEEVNIFNPVNYGVKPDGTIEFAPLYSPHFSGNPTAPTPAVDNSSNRIATTSYVKRQGYATENYVTNQGYLTITDAGTTYAPIDNASFTGTSTFTKAKVSTRFLLMQATLSSTDELLGSSAITAGNYLTTLNPGSGSSYALQQFTAGDSNSQSIIITSGGSFGQTKNTIQSYDSKRDSPLNLYLNPLGGDVHAPTEASTVNDTRIATNGLCTEQFDKLCPSGESCINRNTRSTYSSYCNKHYSNRNNGICKESRIRPSGRVLY